MSIAVRRQSVGGSLLARDGVPSWQLHYGLRLIYSDFLVVVSAVFGAQLLWVRVRSFLAGEPVPADGAQPFATVYSVCLIVAWLGMLALLGSRDPRIAGTGGGEYRRVIVASLTTFGGLAIVVYLFNLQLARGYFLIALPIGLAALLLVRHLWRSWLQAQRREGGYSANVVLAGGPESVAHLARELGRMPEAGFRVVGACLPSGREDDLARELELIDTGPIRIVGDVDHVFEAVEQLEADTVIITSSDELSPQKVRELSWKLEPGNQHLIVAPALTDIGGPRIHIRPVAGLPLVHVETPRYRGGKLHSKRLFDVVASALLILMLSPVLVAVVAAIKLTDPGPVLFRQRRVGRNGRPFQMLKFRTMVVDAEARLAELRALADAGNDILFKMRDDPRVTPVGRFLRRYSLDELPQLFNVLLGEMSLIGPRPPLASEVEEYEHHVHRRFLVKPGITGLWQVNGRSNLSWEESVRLDLYYVENWTLTGDLAILFRTARAVVARDGAY
ncbi:sugar transferase [Pseudolysinimonas yzui]|uniref:Polyprenyl glycosylphosphotransferase n=1 Tax=Pseudolysinimonas yzui TaxID=2708254 RepID=A0A8J3GS74_9MICO|nr:sugar transferase [Pseudolysinimonas yzui]GHF21963.1 polyprenyl glycosylphosphotransferase [Pseudolysinimonas yzui]